MGSEQIMLDHNLSYEIWRGHLFRELCPWFEPHFDEVDVLVAAADARMSSLIIKNSPVYNQWLDSLRGLAEHDPGQLTPLLNHIKASRNRMNELIVIPAGPGIEPKVLNPRTNP